jgi:two-component system response regulator BaeR
MNAHAPPPSILVVDDDDSLRTSLAAALASKGSVTLAASDGTQVPPLIAAHAPSLIMIDLVMPHPEGIQTITQHRKLGCASKIVAMSGDFDGACLRPTLLLGAHATLAKPFTLDSLFSTVQTLLAPANSQTE